MAPSSKEVHLDLVAAAANLKAKINEIKQVLDRKTIKTMVNKVNVPEFNPRSGVKMSITNAELEAANGLNRSFDADDLQKLRDKLDSAESLMGLALQQVEFEKDDDTNFHMDFIPPAHRYKRLFRYYSGRRDASDPNFIYGSITEDIKDIPVMETLKLNHLYSKKTLLAHSIQMIKELAKNLSFMAKEEYYRASLSNRRILFGQEKHHEVIKQSLISSIRHASWDSAYYDREKGVCVIPFKKLVVMTNNEVCRNGLKQCKVVHPKVEDVMSEIILKDFATDNKKYKTTRKLLKESFIMVTPDVFEMAKRGCIVGIICHPKGARLPFTIPVHRKSPLCKAIDRNIFEQSDHVMNQIKSQLPSHF